MLEKSRCVNYLQRLCTVLSKLLRWLNSSSTCLLCERLEFKALNIQILHSVAADLSHTPTCSIALAVFRSIAAMSPVYSLYASARNPRVMMRLHKQLW